jgi:hypothetical protein
MQRFVCGSTRCQEVPGFVPPDTILDLPELRFALGFGHIRLATEGEFRRLFPDKRSESEAYDRVSALHESCNRKTRGRISAGTNTMLLCR